ncbi:hypothetical protein BD408DRAFT_420936 [Parasitella parasitica]|nr:hypothetical protein BD408DRAFT_420936 [Parasitella parasitica]
MFLVPSAPIFLFLSSILLNLTLRISIRSYSPSCLLTSTSVPILLYFPYLLIALINVFLFVL